MGFNSRYIYDLPRASNCPLAVCHQMSSTWNASKFYELKHSVWSASSIRHTKLTKTLVGNNMNLKGATFIKNA